MTQLILSGLTTYSIQTNKNRIRHISASSHKKGLGVWGAEERGLYSQRSYTRGAMNYQKCKILNYRASNCFIMYTVNQGILWFDLVKST